MFAINYGEKCSCIVPVCCLMLFGISGHAIPIASPTPECGKKMAKLKEPENSNGFIPDESCEIIYVFPPERAEVSIDNIARTTNLASCPGFSKLAKMVNIQAKFVEKDMERLSSMYEGLEPYSKEVLSLHQSWNAAKAEFDVRKDEYEIAKAKLDKFEQAFLEAKKAHKMDESPETKQELLQAQKEYKEFNKREFSAVEESYLRAKRLAGELKAKYETKDSELQDARKSYDFLSSTINRQRSESDALYKDYAPRQGMTANAVYVTNWSKLLNEYREKNKDLGFSFLPVPITRADIYWTAYVPEDPSRVLPALLHAEIPGVRKPEPNGDVKIDLKDEQTANASGKPDRSRDLGAGQGSFGGQIVLSLVGACPLESVPNGGKVDNDTLSAHLTVNAFYHFPVKVTRSYKIDYNFSKIVDQMEKKATKSGLFSSSSMHEMSVSTDVSDGVKIELNADDPAANWSTKQQEQIYAEIKAGLIKRILEQVATPVANPPGLVPAPAPYAQQEHPWKWVHPWALIGSWVLNGIGGIFGGTEETSKFKQRNAGWGHEEFKGSQVVERTVTFTFTRPSKLQPAQQQESGSWWSGRQRDEI